MTSRPHYPQGNGLAEHAVQTIKGLLQKSMDLYLVLLAFRSTPLPWCGLSPAQLLMGHNIRPTIPQVLQCFEPGWSYLPEFRVKDALEKRKQKASFNL